MSASGVASAMRSSACGRLAKVSLNAATARCFSQTPRTNKSVSKDTMNPFVRDMTYSIRGRIVDEAAKLQKELDGGVEKPFKEIIFANIGNPQSLGQPPLKFSREVLALIMDPTKIKEDGIEKLYSASAIKRAKEYIAELPGGSAGAYTHSQGLEIVRKDIAKYIGERDGYEADINKIFLTEGASAGVRMVMQTLCNSDGNDAMLVPFPQYPLYTALAALFNVKVYGYYLDEANGWSLTLDELKRITEEARKDSKTVKGLVVISPGNPTGQVMSYENMTEVGHFCAEESIPLMADEVYQTNIYRDDQQFFSFKKVAMDMLHSDDAGVRETAKNLELISFHSASKGVAGECGLRGGYFELHQIDSEVQDELYKLASITLSPNTPGQIMIGLIVNPPSPEEVVGQEHAEVVQSSLESLARRGRKIADALNGLEGMSCNSPDGSMYAFPTITIPQKALDKAEEQEMEPDEFYCLELLKNTGIVTVAGSGFRQREKTWHFRTTFLPPERQIDEFVDKISTFHRRFMSDYAD